MVNPLTGLLCPYEEIWKEEGSEEGLFIRNTRMTKWQARVGARQVGLGRGEAGRFWAWQVERDPDTLTWKVGCSTEGAERLVGFLPEGGSRTERWLDGDRVGWNGDEWDVIEHSEPLLE